MSDIKGALTVPVLREYLYIWELVDDRTLQPGIMDQHCWNLTYSGIYGSKSAYNGFFPWKDSLRALEEDRKTGFVLGRFGVRSFRSWG